MAEEREVTLKLGTQLAPGGDAGLKGIADQARAAARDEVNWTEYIKKRNEQLKAGADVYKLQATEEDKLKLRVQETVRAFEDRKRLQEELMRLGYLDKPLTEEQRMRKEVEDTTKALERRKRVQEELIKLGHAKAPLAEEEHYREQLMGRVKGIEQAKRMQKDLAEMGYGPRQQGLGARLAGAAGGALQTGGMGQFSGLLGGMGPLGAVLAAANLTGIITDDYRHSYDPVQGDYNYTYMGRRWARRGEHLPFGFGTYLEAHNQISDLFRGERHLTEARGAYERHGERLGLTASSIDRTAALHQQMRAQEAQLRFGVGASLQQHTIGRDVALATEAAQSAVAARPSYDRATEQADVALAIGYQGQRASAQAEAARQLGAIDYQLAAASQRSEKLRGELGTAVQARDSQEKLNANATSYEDLTTGRYRLLQAEADMEEKRRQLMQAETQEMGLQQQRLEAMKAAQERMNQLNQQQLHTLDGIVQQERARKQAMTEHLGLMLPQERHATLHVARKLSAGQSLTGMELQFAKSHMDLFGPRLQKIGMQQGAPYFQELRRLLPEIDQREKQAQQMRLELASKTEVTLKVEARDTAQQIADKLLPSLQGMVDRLAEQLKSELDKRNILRQVHANIFGTPGS